MDLRKIEARLPPGFRFYPTDEELVCHYLYRKISNDSLSVGTMVEVDLHTCEPWQLPDVAKLGANEWYFFSYRERKYATGLRTNRATMSGYWKATGKDRPIFSSATCTVVGMRKTLVFYLHRAPNGIKTGWIMHEFRLEIPTVPSEDWALYRVFHKSNGDRITEHNSEDDFDNIGNTTTIVPSLSFNSSINQTMQSSFQQFKPSPQIQPHQESHNSNSFLDITLLNPNFLESPLDMNMSKNSDACEFLYTFNLEE